jgi:hypothetical protein
MNNVEVIKQATTNIYLTRETNVSILVNNFFWKTYLDQMEDMVSSLVHFNLDKVGNK